MRFLPLAAERLGEGFLGLRGEGGDQLGGGLHAGDEVDALAGPYRQPWQLTVGPAAPVVGLRLAAGVKLVFPALPRVVERVPQGARAVLARPARAAGDVEHAVAFGVLAACVDDRLLGRRV